MINKYTNVTPPKVNEKRNYVSTGQCQYDAETKDDIHSFREMKWMRENFLPEVVEIFRNSKSILDVGCGNGRMWPMLRSYFFKIVGIDPFRDPEEIFLADANVTFKSIEFQEYESEEKFDVILFNQSFALLFTFIRPELIKEEFVQKVDSLLSETGHLILVDFPLNHPQARTPNIESEEWTEAFNKYNLYLDRIISPDDQGAETNIFIIKRGQK
jgi:SAM-dependent methyltransferase